MAALAAALVLAGCAAAPLHARTVSLAAGAGGFAEVNVLLAENETVSWEWTANATGLLFNVHSHPQGPSGPVKEWLQRVDVLEDKGSFKATAPGTYSLMWATIGERPVTVTYTVTGGKLDPLHPPTP
jgi:hypothetical protein